MSWTRRATLGGAAAALAAPASAQLNLYKSQLGPGTGAQFGWATMRIGGRPGPATNADTRFPMCSSFKWLLAAFVLARVDAGTEHLERPVGFTAADIQDYAPKAKAVLAEGGGARAAMSVAALCEAAVTLSDNTAANLLLGTLGGPPALTAWLKAQGDPVTRLDRVEPAMNFIAPGDNRDTTTPAAMIGDLRRILFGNVLKPASRAMLMRWLLDCKTGDARLKAGLPAGWRIAHKTGTLDYHPELPGIRSGAAADVGVLFPPRGAPILIAAYTAGSSRPPADVDAWFAGVARQVTGSRW